MHIGDKAALGRWLVSLRQAKGQSARYAAQKAKVSLSSLLSWERGATFPSIYNLIKMLRYYGVSATFGVDSADADGN